MGLQLCSRKPAYSVKPSNILYTNFTKERYILLLRPTITICLATGGHLVLAAPPKYKQGIVSVWDPNEKGSSPQQEVSWNFSASRNHWMVGR